MWCSATCRRPRPCSVPLSSSRPASISSCANRRWGKKPSPPSTRRRDGAGSPRPCHRPITVRQYDVGAHNLWMRDNVMQIDRRKLLALMAATAVVSPRVVYAADDEHALFWRVKMGDNSGILFGYERIAAL